MCKCWFTALRGKLLVMRCLLVLLPSLPVWYYRVYLLRFFAAKLVLEITGLDTRYAHITRGLGGSVLLIIGGVMIQKPDWLM